MSNAGVDALFTHRARLLVQSPRGLGAIAGLNGITLRSIARWRSPSRDATPGSWMADDDSHRLRPAVEEVFPGILQEPAKLASTVLERIGGWAWHPDAQAARPYLTAAREWFHDAAEQLVRAPGARWWWDPIDRARQTLLSGVVPSMPKAASSQVDPDVLSAADWRIPRQLTTSTMVSADMPAVELCDPEVIERLPEPVGCWRTTVSADVTVYEIGSPDDWRQLCERYPREITLPTEFRKWDANARAALVPDWPNVARDWDGLHLCIGGLLSTAGLPIQTGDLVCLLEDVDTELTTWFNPRFRVDDLIASYDERSLPL